MIESQLLFFFSLFDSALDRNSPWISGTLGRTPRLSPTLSTSRHISRTISSSSSSRASLQNTYSDSGQYLEHLNFKPKIHSPPVFYSRPYHVPHRFSSELQALVFHRMDHHREAYDRKSVREFTCAPHIVGDSCDGVFCVEYRRNAALWNPATRETRVLELDYGRWFDLDSKLVRWVGFGSVKDERSNVVNFKLLLVVTDDEEDEEEEVPIVHILVYSLRANSLNLVKFPCFPLRNISQNGSVYLKGVLHWLAKGGEGGEGAETAYILTFDLVSETFTKIDLPSTDWIDIQDKNRYFLTVLDNQYLSFGMVDQAALCLNMWALHEINGQRSWVRREKIGPLMKAGLMVKYCDTIRGVITQADLDGRFWYHGKGNASKHDTGLYGLTNWFEYSESLVSLKRIANGQVDNVEDND